MKKMQSAMGKVHIVELRGADHYVYFTNEAAVLREIRKFVADIRPPFLAVDIGAFVETFPGTDPENRTTEVY